MFIVRWLGRLLNRTIQGAVALAVIAAVGFLLDRALLGDAPRRGPERRDARDDSSPADDPS
jgi:hypothetical protein